MQDLVGWCRLKSSPITLLSSPYHKVSSAFMNRSPPPITLLSPHCHPHIAPTVTSLTPPITFLSPLPPRYLDPC